MCKRKNSVEVHNSGGSVGGSIIITIKQNEGAVIALIVLVVVGLVAWMRYSGSNKKQPDESSYVAGMTIVPEETTAPPEDTTAIYADTTTETTATETTMTAPTTTTTTTAPTDSHGGGTSKIDIVIHTPAPSTAPPTTRPTTTTEETTTTTTEYFRYRHIDYTVYDAYNGMDVTFSGMEIIGINGEPTETLVIPENLNGEQVIAIGDSAFAGQNFRYVSMPGVRYIGANAFNGAIFCYELDLSDIAFIGESAFYNCGLINHFILGAPIKIGAAAFRNDDDCTERTFDFGITQGYFDEKCESGEFAQGAFGNEGRYQTVFADMIY